MSASYKERLGLDPSDQPPLKTSRFDPKAKQAYEENLSKFKDERDAIQKKTFTKWVNKHLKKAGRQVTDLFTDLQDGLNLISLLEVLTGEQLHREKGRMRFHMLQNVELVLNFLRFKKIKLVNIRPEDIVDGNPKLTLGLIWTIILHFQISDIVVGEEPNVSARDVLLRWAKKTTAKYPGVRVSDFTQSWRDGLAFNAIIHRNRPDLIDWRQIRTKTVRDRLETAFYTAEKVGVTRLLDPEDVDTHEIDEKSIITYVSSMYDIFPEPPPNHPLYDAESQALVQEYRQVASSLHLWLREKITYFSSALPPSLHELKKLSHESARFKTDEVPLRHRDKTKLHHIYRDLQKYFESVGEVEIEPELHVDILDRNWNKLMALHQERDISIQEEIKKCERLERLAEKVQREVKRVDGRLDDVETKIQEESRRVDRLFPLDAKHNVDVLEAEMRQIEEHIQGLFQDVQALKAGNHPLSSDLHKRVNKLHQRWVSLRSMLHSKLIARLASVSFPVVEERTVTRQTRTVLETRLVDTNTHFRSLQQAIDWCNNKIKQLEEADYGTDLHSAKSELSYHQREQKEIDKFQSTVDRCISAKSNFHGEELSLYMQHLSQLQKLYSEVVTLSNKRTADLESLLDLLQSVANQLSWLQDKQHVEAARDWTDKDLNLHHVNQYYQNLMSELEKREVSVRSVVDRGQSLFLQGHPGKKAIETALLSLQSNWSYLLQLMVALETHLKTVTHYRQFHQDLVDLDNWINSRDEILNTTYSVVEFGLDEGERLLKGMQELREELNSRTTVIQELQERALTVHPIRQRRLPVVRPIQIRAVCDYKQQNMNIEKGDSWLLHDNSALTKWRVSETSGSTDVNIPGAVFLIPPPCRESIDAANRLAQRFESTLALWQRKQLRMRQNMIFATIKVVRSWDLAQFVAMGSDQRNAIRKALNEDADKLLSEGDPSDPQLRRLRVEMDEVNRLFDEFERRARQEEEMKTVVRQWNEVMSKLQINLDDFERTLNNRLTSHIPRDVHSLEHMVIQHKDFETKLKALTPDIENAQSIFNNIPRKTPQLQSTMDQMLKQWNQLWNSSHIYIERLKCVEIMLNSLDESNNAVSELEVKLASFGDMPSELEPLQITHDDLIRVQNAIAAQQPIIDQLLEDATNTRRVVVRSRDRLKHDHADLDRMDDDVNSITSRWNNLCASLVDRLRSCETAYSLLENYGKTYQTEVKYIDESYTQLNNLPPVSHSKHHIEPTRVLFTSIVERTQPLEQVNIDGGRFIREAKIYNLRLRRFVEAVEAWQPSVDAAARPAPPARGEEFIANQLDKLNHRFLALCAILQDRLKQLAIETADKQLLELVMGMERTQLRTFRTEFSLFESSDLSKTTTIITTNGCDGLDMGNKVNGEAGEALMRERRVEEGIGTGVGGGAADLVGITDPGTGERLTIAEAIRRRILDVRSGRIQGVTIEEAVERGYVEKELAEKLLAPCGPHPTLLRAIQRELSDAERGPAHRVKQAMEEKYKLCDDTLKQLLEWITEVEDRLAKQDLVQEDLDQLRNQINIMKLMKEEIESQARMVAACLEQVRVVASTGAEYLSRDEINSLERGGKQLRTRFDRASDRTDKLLRRLTAAHDELNKFMSEVGVFEKWLDKARRGLDDREKALGQLNPADTRDFVSDVIAHQADLRFITMAANKFFHESKEYLVRLNEYRAQLASRLAKAEPLNDSTVRATVQHVSDDYRDLLSRATALQDRLTGLGGRHKEYTQALDRLRHWLSQAEPRAHKIIGESVAADPHSIEDQLNRAKALSNEFLSQGRLVDNLKQAVDSLVRSLEGNATPSELSQLESPVKDLCEKYTRLSNQLADKVNQLDTALGQSQGVEDSLESINQWLTSSENSLKMMSRPASLHKERLEEQVREVKLLLADIDSHRGSVQSITDQARSLVSQTQNPRLAKRIETKYKDVISRFEKLVERSGKRAELLAETSEALVQFSHEAAELERWATDLTDQINAGTANLDDASRQRDINKDRFEKVLRDGKNLVSKKDVTDTTVIRDKIKTLENAWRDLSSVLDEKNRLGKAKEETKNSYDKLRDQVLAWLNNMETRVARLEPVAVHLDVLKRQADDVKPIIKEHREYNITIEKLFDVGNNLESLMRPDSGSSSLRRRISISPTKKTSLSQISSRRGSSEITSQTKITITTPHGTSTTYSRRLSTDSFHGDAEGGSVIQTELSDIQNRYTSVGTKLSERQSEIDSVREEVRRASDSLKTLDTLIEKLSRNMPRDGGSLPANKQEADHANKVIKGILEEMYEKQSLLESTKNTINDLLRRKPTAIGADALRDQLADVTTRWKNLHDACKSRIKLLDDLREILDTCENLNTWLVAKDRMFNALGPISSDPRMVQSQIQQVQVMREELRTQQPTVAHVTSLCEAVVSRAPEGPDSGRLRSKASSLSSKFDELSEKLDARAAALGAAVDSSRELGAQLARLTDTMQAISDQIDQIPRDTEPQVQLSKIQGCERQLEGVRGLLSDAEVTGEELCRVITDAATRAEIQGKLQQVNRQYNSLQAKIDLRKAEIEAMLRDGREFDEAVARTVGWLNDGFGSLTERLLVSADKDVLQQQLDSHEPLYKEVIRKEHEVIMLLDKGREKASEARQLDSIRTQWDKLKKEVVDRQTRLQTAYEQCKKYYKSLEQLLPWLTQAENKLESLRPESFTKKDVEKHLRDLANFRNDVWKKSGEYEHTRALGESFLAGTDTDKEGVRSELAALAERWERLGSDAGTRAALADELLRRLGGCTDRLRDLAHAVQRCEDRLASHDAVGASDPASLARLNGVREEASGLGEPVAALLEQAQVLDREAAQMPARSALANDVLALRERLDDVRGRLDDRCSLIHSANRAVQQFNEKLKAVNMDLSALEGELDAMKPPARDIKTVRQQQDQIHNFTAKLSDVGDKVQSLESSADALVDSGYASDAAAIRQQAATAGRSLAALEERARSRADDLAHTLDRLEQFHSLLDSASDNIDQASDELRRLKPVGSEVETIKSQQEEFSRLRDELLEPCSRSLDQVNRSGQSLIQTAAGGVSTAQIEKDLENINNKFNSLKDKVNERGRKLDSGLLHSGKFQEALEGLNKWLTDTEEMVANQRPPSADYKVVKAQLQEQKFLKKMLADREGSVSGLFAMGSQVAEGAEPSERAHIERQIGDLVRRYDHLTSGAAERQDALEKAMAVAKHFQDKLVPVVEWLDKTEKKIKDMELVPTDEEKIQNQIREHNALHNEILRKKPALTELTEVGSQLMSLVGEDEATHVADKIQETANRYSNLVDSSESVGGLLDASRAGLRHLVLSYQQLQGWMESMEVRLGRYKVLAVHTDKLLAQMDDLADLTEEISNRQGDIDSTVDSGLELMKHISNDEAIQLKDKLDSLQRRYNQLTSRGADLLKQAQEALPLVQQFHNAHNRLGDWMMGAESQLQQADPREEDIQQLEQDIHEFRPVVENINQVGPQLCSLSPGEGAQTIEGLVTRDNRRFDSIVEQIQRKAERLHLSKQRSLEVLGDIDALLEWFREVEGQLRDADLPSSEPKVIRLQLKEHKALNDDISSQKGRVRDVLQTAKKVLRETRLEDDASLMRDKMSDLRETMDSVWAMSGDRLGILEQALALATHLVDSHNDLASWLDEIEQHVRQLPLPAIRPQAIAQQQDRTQMLLQSISEHKPLVDKLNKTGEALIKLVVEEEGVKVQEMLDADNARYAALRSGLKQRQDALEKALQESSQFSDKLEGMLRALNNTADEVSNLEPVSAHPPKIKQQQNENKALIDDLDKRQEAFDAVKRAAEEVISKAPNSSDPAVKDVRAKLDRLTGLWADVKDATRKRGRSLDETLAVAARFWTELQSVMATLADLEASLAGQQPPAARPQAIERQQRELQEIKAEIEQTKPEVEQVRRTGHSLMALCGEPDKPEVKKHIEDLDNAWDTVTALFAKREENLINAMEKAMEFHETLTDLLEFLKKAEEKFAKLGPLGSDIETVKKQIGELKDFKSAVDPYMVKVEALNRQAQDLTERTSADQAAGLKESLSGVNSRWDELHRGIAERSRALEHSLLRLGQFQHALDELVAWIRATDATLDRDIRPVPGDSHLLEIELAKLKVLLNDIQAHQSSVDTLNDAGRQLIESGRGTREASTTQDKLDNLNKNWKSLAAKANAKHRELEEALHDAHRFGAEMQDMLAWLGEVDSIITSSKPVGGLPETATEQLERFMDLYREIESARPKVESILAQGNDYLKRAGGQSTGQLGTNLKTLKQRWDSVTSRANDKKIKLEIALKEATEFHQALQAFVDWLTSAEKTLGSLKPVSRVLETIQEQMEEHKSFQKEVGNHRETMIQLDKKGTHLKYFSQKQDVILIKNLLISVQHRWERVVTKSAERTRALDHGYKEAKEFHDSWVSLMNWLTETETTLDEVADEIASAANDPARLKQRLAKHRDTQKALAAKQPQYDSCLRAGKTVRERAPKSDEAALKLMVSQLKEKWNAVCSKAVDRQRKLEEALLYCGQFKDALEALMDWLRKTHNNLSEDTLVHGDLDTVHALIDQHKALEKEMLERSKQMQTVEKTGGELASKAGQNAESQALLSQLTQLTSLWKETSRLVESRGSALQQALIQAEELHKQVHMLLEWLSDAEMKLRFVDSLPDDDVETAQQISIHEKFMREMKDKERDKESTIALAERILAKAHPDATSVIKHWITIIESRWEEVASWALTRKQKLQQHLKVLHDLDSLLEELLDWLARVENDLLEKERQELPSEIPKLQILITEHHQYMEEIMTRQSEVDAVCKAKMVKPVEKERKGSTPSKKLSTPSKDDLRHSSTNLTNLDRRQSLKSSRDNLGTFDRKSSRSSPARELFIDSGMTPHFGPRFPAKGSKAAEPQFRSPRARLLWDRWRNVWLLAWERQRRLQQGLNHLEELEKLANFSWDEWRKRFLKFMNHKKARITDLMRKMDRNNDNLIPREDFIDGIIKTKFDTSKLEMGAVADMFDHSSEGVIDWKEFIAALRPDWEEPQPRTEADKIHDEVKRLVMLCTCRQKFRVYQVGEGKYRFGDSQKLRLVRILRSTVMVRVGGGWVALEEFLVKNDPCRAKGRTNIELREQFILADGVSQSMSAFKPKTSTSSRPSISSGSQGPITKVKEKTSRSVPMGRNSNASSRGAATPGSVDSLSDTEGGSPAYSTPYRKTGLRSSLNAGGSLPGSRNSSRPTSRQGSKPPSRHGSSLSLASSDDGTPGSRIPRRSYTSTRPGTSPTPRKMTAPAGSLHVNGTSKSPSTPSTPASKSQIPRASSIPTLAGYGNRSKIPVYVGMGGSSVGSEGASPTNDISLPSSCSSSSGARTPSTGSGVKVTRRGSAASDSQRKSTSASGTPLEATPTDPKAPFRL